MNTNIFKKKSVIILMALICCALWGSAFPCIKTGYRLFQIASDDYFSQILFAGIRFFLAGILAVIFGSVQSKKVLLPNKNNALKILILCLLQTIIQYTTFYISLAHIAGVKGSILNGASTLISVVLACIFFKTDRMTMLKAIGCILGFAGIVFVNLNGLSLSGGVSFLGEGLMMISTCSSAIATVCVKVFTKDESPALLSGYQFMLGGFVMIIIGFAMGGRVHMAGVGGILLLVYMALISSVAFTLWGTLLKYNPVSQIVIFGFTRPIFGTFLSAIILSEYSSLNVNYVFALILVALGIYLVNRKKTDL